MIGLFLVYVIKQIWLKKHIGHGISSTLYAISKLNGIIPRYNIYASLTAGPCSPTDPPKPAVNGAVISDA